MPSLATAKLRKPTELRIHCDEAGRGPLAGPVTVGCCLLIKQIDTSPYKDSKQLTKKQREVLYERIKQIGSPPGQGGTKGGLLPPGETCLPAGRGRAGGDLYPTSGSLLTSTGRATANEIDKHGIVQAISLACCRGIGQVLKEYYETVLRRQLLTSDFGEDILAIRLYDILFTQPIDETTVQHFMQIPNSYAHLAGLIRDGNHTFGLDKLLDISVVTIIKGDQKNPLISIASIVAKVERDAYMEEISPQFPTYEFAKHKGYGTQLHRDRLKKYGCSPLHRTTFCKNFTKKKAVSQPSRKNKRSPSPSGRGPGGGGKPSLLLHICCAPDLSRPLHWLKKHFKLYLFWYNPNIHPRKEHEQRYSQFLKLVGLEPGDYEILEDRYDPQEFFDAMVDKKETIHPDLTDASKNAVLKKAGEMEERSDRCNPCYSMRLETAAKMAAAHDIPYFTSTLLISPKKIMEKLFARGKASEQIYPTTKFLWFDFPKNGGYQKAVELTKTHQLRRQNYCGCGRTIPKPGEKRIGYTGG